MNRPLLAIGLILLAFGLTAGVFAFSTHDRWDDRHRTVEYHITSDSPGGDDGDGGRVLVVDDGRHWGPGFFPLFPLIVLGGILTVFALAGRGRHGGPRHWDARDRFDDWHRTAHAFPGATPSATTPPPGDTTPREQ